MAKQYIYIARHGESNGNLGELIQTPDEELTDDGHAQARQLATRATSLSFKRLLVSDMKRAQQTAQYIAEATNVPIETTTDLHEFANPTRFQSRSRHDEEFLEHIQERITSYADGEWDWKDSTEESFREFKARVERVQNLFSSTDENMFAVTHGQFLRFFTANLLCGPHFTPQVWHSIGNRMMLSNTGISVFVRDLDDNRWYVQNWNDTAHFAE